VIATACVVPPLASVPPLTVTERLLTELRSCAAHVMLAVAFAATGVVTTGWLTVGGVPQLKPIAATGAGSMPNTDTNARTAGRAALVFMGDDRASAAPRRMRAI
jgi:hypothetical protein